MKPVPDFTGRMFGYARVSTEDQNLDMQIKALIAAGVPENLIFSEKKSGKNMDRPAWKKLMRAVRPGDCVVVWKLDRLGRSLVGVIKAVEEFRNNDIHFRVLMDHIDTTSPMGTFTMHLFAAMAQLERDITVQRTRAGIEAAQARGVVFGRQHYILAHPKRLRAWHKLAMGGKLHDMDTVQIINAMHDADPDAPRYKHPQSYINWYSEGYKGLKDALRLADLPMPKNLPKPKKRKKKGE